MEELAIAFRILKRGWWIILSTAVLAGSITSLLSARSIPTYQTNLRMFVTADMIQLEGRDLIYGYSSLDGSSIVTTFVEITNSRRMRENAARNFNQASEFFDRYTVSTVDLPNSSVLELVVTGPNPQVVQYFANAIAQSAVDFVRANYSAYKLEILDSAFLPTIPIRPNFVQDIVVSLVLGTVLGILIAVGADLLPNPVKTIQSWASFDRQTHTLKRRYFERHMDDWLYSDGMNTNLALIRLAKLPQLEETLAPTGFKQLLKEITQIIREEVRGKDIISRWSDDSFAVLMPGVSSDQAAATLEQISRKLANLNVEDEGLEPEPLKPVIGAVMLTERLPYLSIIKRAEAALDKASKNGSEGIILLPDLSIQKVLSVL
jgi:diguanylate cyclase (GGDEF)-like protein